MFRSGLTKRWLFSTVLVIAAILAVFALIVIRSVHDYYYDYAEKRLQALGQSGALADFFNGYTDLSGDGFSERAGEYLHSSTALSVAEVWIYNGSDEIVATSTGFEADPSGNEDYEIARTSPSGRGLSTTYLASGERVMALTVFLPKTGGQSNGAVRYIVSLEDMQNKLHVFTGFIVILCLFAFVLVLVSGSFFIRSIVSPVKKINQVTRKIAMGEYSEKVQVMHHYDEITELSHSINEMTDALAKTDRMKNDFVSTVSHELRTPLTAIKGWTETLIELNDSGDATLVEGLHVILSESERLYTMVEELLDFSRMESGRMTLRLQRFDVLAELEEAVDVMTERAAREGKHLECTVPETAAPIEGDPDRIKQVFVNLLDNAFKYTPVDGYIRVTAVLEKTVLRVLIADTGCGIAPEALPHVKEKFYKANMSVKGSGIGLAVSDEIMSLHGGSLQIRSVLNEGTQAELVFPLELPDADGGKGKT